VTPTTTPTSLRFTPQRRAIYDVLCESEDHPTAGDILERVQRRVPGIGAATVYRTLAWLVQSGQAAELRLGEADATRYDRSVHRHDHLVCVQCGQVEDVHVPLDHKLLDELAGPTSFQPSGYDVQIHGRCARCAAANAHNVGGIA